MNNNNHTALMAFEKHLNRYHEIIKQIEFNKFLLLNIVKKRHKRRIFINRIIDLEELAEIEILNAKLVKNSNQRSA